ncbi:MAG: NUDIX domain-containing protein [Candidatus Velthaea sp.]
MGGFIRRAKRIVYENPWLRFEAHDIVHPSGAPGEHGVVVTPQASAVVAIEDGDVWLTRQARFAIDRTVLEIVKGGAHTGETPRQCAQRETREEIGVTAERWDDLGMTYELPSLVQEPVALFLARDLRHVPNELEAIESIDTMRLPFLVALDAVASGEIDDAVTAIALLRAARLLA